jgi:lipoprotein NlpI
MAYCDRAGAMVALGDFTGAITNLHEAIRLAPKSAFVYTSCGWDWLEIGDYAAALTNFNRAIELDSTNSSAYTGAGCAQNNMSQLQPALKSFQKAESLDPSWIYAWYHIYLLEVRLGGRAAAEKELAGHMKSLTDTKANDWSAKVGDYLDAALSEKDFFQTATNSAPNSAVQSEQLCEADYYAGMQYLLAGKKNEAVSLFQKCLDTGEKDFMEYTSARAELNILKN